jgi:hypothetical protein
MSEYRAYIFGKDRHIASEVANGFACERTAFLSPFSQTRKNAHQTPPRIKAVRTVLTVNINSIDGPGSA